MKDAKDDIEYLLCGRNANGKVISYLCSHFYDIGKQHA